MDTVEMIRYKHLVHRTGSITPLFDIGQIKLIGSIASYLPEHDFSLLYPWSFADLHLYGHPFLAERFASLQPFQQCRVLDVAIETARLGEPLAMVAVSHETGSACLVSLGKEEQTIKERAQDYLNSPLLQAMVDEALEPDVYQVLQQTKQVLEGARQYPESLSLCLTECSEEFFIDHVLCFPLTAEFSLTWGPHKDEYGRLLPSYLHEVLEQSHQQDH